MNVKSKTRNSFQAIALCANWLELLYIFNYFIFKVQTFFLKEIFFDQTFYILGHKLLKLKWSTKTRILITAVCNTLRIKMIYEIIWRETKVLFVENTPTSFNRINSWRWSVFQRTSNMHWLERVSYFHTRTQIFICNVICKILFRKFNNHIRGYENWRVV